MGSRFGLGDIVAGCSKNAGTGTQLGVGDWDWLTAESLHMQHAGPNARRAGVGLLHVASEAALSTGQREECRRWVMVVEVWRML